MAMVLAMALATVWLKLGVRALLLVMMVSTVKAWCPLPLIVARDAG